MLKKAAVTAVPIDELLSSRWSGRAYDSTRSVAPEDILALLEAARWSPSCFGEQPWRLLIWNKFQNAEAWERAAVCLADANKGWAMAAPVLMLACASRRFSRNQQENRWCEYDTGAACMALSLQATALGLMAHQMGGFDAEAIRTAFRIPEEYTAMAMIAVGYQLAESQIPDALRERESAPRSRAAMESMFYADAWGRGVTV